MTFGKIRIKKSSEELDEFYAVPGMPDKVIDVCHTVEANLKFQKGLPTLHNIYTDHQTADWDWSHFETRLSCGTAVKDHIAYANCIHSELIQRVYKKGGKALAKYLLANKKYSVVLSNWAFNNHLAHYAKQSFAIPKSLCVYTSNNSRVGLLVSETYEMLRVGGCSVDIAEDGSRIRKYPSEALPTVNALDDFRGKRFSFIHGYKMDTTSVYKLKEYINDSDVIAFESAFPLVLILNVSAKHQAHRKFMLEVNLDE